MIGATEAMIIVGGIVLLFGSAKIPELARRLGEAKAEFSKGQREIAASPTLTAAAAPAPVEKTEEAAR